ncbi:MAG: YqgE/AlgH family protein [Pedobacter sp.]|nr:YqgE/AlgH family protein [Pedobacter sp.]
MLNTIKPARGRLLVSEPFIADPNFKRSVVLITTHDEEGTIGFILNQPEKIRLKDVLPDTLDAQNKIYFGGPVQTDSIFFIHRCYDKMLSGEAIGGGIYWGGNFETLKILVNTNAISESEIKFFVGYSGWGEEQLQQELEQNAWMVSDIPNPDNIFSAGDEKLWRDVVVNLGPKYAHIGNFPSDPSLN